MALLPCDGCRQRFIGKSTVLYAAFMRDGQRTAFQERLCFSCAQEVLGRLKPLFLTGEGGYVQLPEVCHSCSAAVDAEEQEILYITGFYKQDRLDGTVVVCEPCTNAIKAEFETVGKRLDDRGPGGRNGGAPMPAPSKPQEEAKPW